MKKLFIALFLLSLFLSSCKNKGKEDAIPQINNECFFSTNQDSTEIAHKLLGKWNWQYSFSGWTAEYSDTANEGLSLEFKSDGVLTIKRSGEAMQTADWSLRFNGIDFALVTQPTIIETLGPVLFCKNQLLFQGGAGDGTNNYFKRN